jgi:hypothetical protein
MTMRSLRVPVALALALSLPLPSVALAQVPPPPQEAAPKVDESISGNSENMTEEQKTERAKTLFADAEALAAQERWAEATPLYEEAYYLVPGKHGFAHKVGIAAWKSGDCNKADIYLKHFITYGDPEKQKDKIDEAKVILGEISVSGCATTTTTTTTTTTNTATPEEEENPLGESTKDERQGEAANARRAKKDEKRGLLIGGAVLISVGVIGVGMGAAGLGVSSSSSNQLADLSTNATNTGFPVGDYSCRDKGEPCPYDLERRMTSMNIMAGVGFGIGGAALLGGIAMIAIYSSAKKKRGGSMEGKAEVTAFGPTYMPGGGAGAMAAIRF